MAKPHITKPPASPANPASPAARYPFLRGLDRMRLRFGKLRGSSSTGVRPTLALGAGLDFRESRRYAPGDDLRFLDWNAYGRLNQLYLKQFEAFGELMLDVIVDRTPSMDFGGKGPGTAGHKLTFARNLAAALGYVGLNSLDRAQMLTLPWAAHQRLIAWQGRNRIPQWLDAVDRLDVAPIQQHARTLLDLLADRRNNHMVVVITDFQESEVWFSFLEALRRHTPGIFVLHLLAPEERDPPLHPGDVDLFDGEWSRGKGSRVELTSAALTAYREELFHHLRRVHAWCRQKRIGYMLLDTAAPPSTELWQQFRLSGLWD
ncbi:MAG: DUF58 domain-containing protein [Planctomycetota bacterium]